VSQEFRERKWKVVSIDNDVESNATLKMNINDLNFRQLTFVPDFIWASPPCQTYSLMMAGKHRNSTTGELERTPTAREHNFFFTKLVEIIRWAREKHPHLIFVIENPVGLLSKMPLMVSFKHVVDSSFLHDSSSH
jgi:site-specific DNA-cytosine methylase